MLDLSIIIVSYNTKKMTIDCLCSVYEQTSGISFEVIVVDNDSTDHSAQAIEEKFHEVYLIQSKENLGFARANNLAAQRAKGKYLLLLNPDTIVLDGAIQKLHNFALNYPNNSIYGGKTVYGDHSLNPTSCWRRPTLWSLFCYASGLTSLFRNNGLFDPESYGKWKRDSVRLVDIVTGCFLMIDGKLWNHLGGFDPEFFMYGEDADLCLRAAKAGARPIISPDACIVHYCGASEKVRADKIVRLFRAKGQLFRRHWSPVCAMLGTAMLSFSVSTRFMSCFFLNAFGAKTFSGKMEIWAEICRRRKEWLN